MDSNFSQVVPSIFQRFLEFSPQAGEMVHPCFFEFPQGFGFLFLRGFQAILIVERFRRLDVSLVILKKNKYNMDSNSSPLVLCLFKKNDLFFLLRSFVDSKLISLTAGTGKLNSLTWDTTRYNR